MDLEKLLNEKTRIMRKATFDKSDQMSLGDIISEFEKLTEEQRYTPYGEELPVVFDFVYMRPTGIDSWRGSYDELAFSYTSGGDAMKYTEFLEMLKGAVGATFTGYKGGTYTMTEHTPVWVANGSEVGDTAVVGVTAKEFVIILNTGIVDYLK
jgi:hypothetical protein